MPHSTKSTGNERISYRRGYWSQSTASHAILIIWLFGECLHLSRGLSRWSREWSICRMESDPFYVCCQCVWDHGHAADNNSSFRLRMCCVIWELDLQRRWWFWRKRNFQFGLGYSYQRDTVLWRKRVHLSPDSDAWRGRLQL